MNCNIPLPEEKDWKFIDELKSPLWRKINWKKREAAPGEISLAPGIKIVPNFPDPESLLDTAYADLNNFFSAAGITTGGNYSIVTEKQDTGEKEAFRIDITGEQCRIISGDSEGIRRAIYHLEDEICRHGGPYLTEGVIERKSFIKTRVSRCFFGPIKRPPRNRDELMDNVDYYPDEYLNRLAHEGVNALWLTLSFRDVCPSPLFPEHAKDWRKRLEKLNKTIKKCTRYGIKIYAFCIEPMGFGPNSEYLLSEEELTRHPDLCGHETASFKYFCTSSPKGLKYIEDCTRFLFEHAPGLGGLIDINMGERPTHCYSSLMSLKDNNCPRCSKRTPGEVFADTLKAFARGMHSVNPEAEMIAWLYVPWIKESHGLDVESTKKVLNKIAGQMPEDITFQYNFESAGEIEQLGKTRYANDYWLAWDGPSEIYRNCVKNAAKNGARTSAKIQVGCSHEVATVPFVPVPGILYRKYKAMHELGVSSVMQCWYFGNYPGIMNKAAGELSFEPFPASQTDFLENLARIDWGENARTVAKAWQCFDEGYSSFPVEVNFTHYGPIHNSIVWPLHLFPADEPIAPSWRFTFPLESGDRIGECICYGHTIDETLQLLKIMKTKWGEGVRLIEKIEPQYQDNRARMLDIGLAQALEIQIASADNIMNFYALRERLPFEKPEQQRKMLDKMKLLVNEEITNGKKLIELCNRDSRLGFHSEAEGYKYFAKKIQWRMECLEKLLERDFPAVSGMISSGKPLFPEYTGKTPQGKVYRLPSSEPDAPGEVFENDPDCRWKAWQDNGNIHIHVTCRHSVQDMDLENITVNIEPCRLWPVQGFIAYRNGKTQHDNLCVIGDHTWKADIRNADDCWQVNFTIPLKIFTGYHKPGRPLRCNVLWKISNFKVLSSWNTVHPWNSRLAFRTENTNDLGWLMLNN